MPEPVHISVALNELRAELQRVRETAQANARTIEELRERAAAPQEVLTMPEAAELVGVSERTLRRMVRKRAVPFYRIGPGRRLIRFRRTQLVEWQKRGGKKPGTPRFHSAPHSPGTRTRAPKKRAMIPD